ncbi:MAG: hypothetical protein KAR06_00445 [Deltaproteobacteria bacterium]|nr:hypothetical protein [Deltaproteobacteria bacterium]
MITPFREYPTTTCASCCEPYEEGMPNHFDYNFIGPVADIGPCCYEKHYPIYPEIDMDGLPFDDSGCDFPTISEVLLNIQSKTKEASMHQHACHNHACDECGENFECLDATCLEPYEWNGDPEVEFMDTPFCPDCSIFRKSFMLFNKIVAHFKELNYL